ncbi:MAG: alpha/beta fold hydrolase [Leptospiraceae bacterium]|nr:alpha/beta fold hydrolase [Leptospiraceae bacterium]
MRRFIWISLALPIVLLVLWWLVRTWNDFTVLPESWPQPPLAFESQSESLTAADGSQIPTVQLKPLHQVGLPAGTVVLIAEQGRDMNWQSRGLSFASGRRVAALLGQAGFSSWRYDQRGTGSNRASLKSALDLQLLSNDLKQTVLAAARNQAASLDLVAHGNLACALALHLAGQKTGRVVKRLVLIECLPESSYLQMWFSDAQLQMLRRAIPLAEVDQAALEWEQRMVLPGNTSKAFRRDPFTGKPAADKGKQSGPVEGLIGFLTQNPDFFKQAAELDTAALLQTAVRSHQVYWLLAEHSMTYKLWQHRQSKVGPGGCRNQPLLIRGADHMLRAVQAPAASLPGRFMLDAAPIMRLAPDFKSKLLAIMVSGQPEAMVHCGH